MPLLNWFRAAAPRPSLGRAARRWRETPVRRLGSPSDLRTITERYLLYVLLPAWLAPGLLDAVWHRRTAIERTSGTRESAIHALMMTEVGVPVALSLLFEVNPLVLAIMIGNLGLHWATAFWDVSTAVRGHREVRPNEQHLHSLLEVLPFMATSFMVCLHWDQLRALGSRRRADWTLRLKRPRLPTSYLVTIGAGIVACLVLPYADEMRRCLRADRARRRRMRALEEHVLQ